MSQCFAMKHLETQYSLNFRCFQMGKKYIMTGGNRSTYTNCISFVSFYKSPKKGLCFKLRNQVTEKYFKKTKTKAKISSQLFKK